MIWLILVATAWSAEPLRSSAIKSQICTAIDRHFLFNQEELFYYDDIDESKCRQGRFLVTDSTFNTNINALSKMTITYSGELSSFSVKGKFELKRHLEIDDEGEVTKSWKIKSEEIQVDDLREISEIVRELYEEDRFSAHNGDFGVYRLQDFSNWSEQQLISQIEVSLPNDGYCEYDTTTTTRYVLSDIDEVVGDLGQLVKKLHAEGRIRFAISRTYSDGPSEYCSHYYYRFVLDDGQVIYFDGDFTT